MSTPAVTPTELLVMQTVRQEILAATTTEQRDRIVVEWLEALDFGEAGDAQLGRAVRHLARAVADWRQP